MTFTMFMRHAGTSPGSGRSPRSRIEPLVVGREVDQLVHEPLAEAFQLGRAVGCRGPSCVKSEYMQLSQQRIALNAARAGVEVPDVVALTGGADEGAGSAAQAGTATAPPTWGFGTSPSDARRRSPPDSDLPKGSFSSDGANLRLLCLHLRASSAVLQKSGDVSSVSPFSVLARRNSVSSIDPRRRVALPGSPRRCRN